MALHTWQGGNRRQIISTVLNTLSKVTELSDFSPETCLTVPPPHIHPAVTSNTAWDKFQRSQFLHGHIPTTTLPQSPPKSNILRNVWYMTSPELITNIGFGFRRCHVSSTDG